jgi:molybdopterin/thiamine biosynthesis adenylyltransferase
MSDIYYYFREDLNFLFNENKLMVATQSKLYTIQISDSNTLNFLKKCYNEHYIIYTSDTDDKIKNIITVLVQNNFLIKIDKNIFNILNKNDENNRTRHYFLNFGNIIEFFSNLADKSIIIIGIGGIGCEILRQLISIGLKNFILVDYDKVDITNLNRQFYFNYNDVGKNKIEVITEKIKNEYKNINLRTFNTKINNMKDIKNIFDKNKIDFIVCAADSPFLKIRKYLLQISIESNTPIIFGGIGIEIGTIGPLIFDNDKKKKYLENINNMLKSKTLHNVAKGSFGVTNSVISNLMVYDIIMYLLRLHNKTKSTNKILQFNFNDYTINKICDI